MIFESQYWKQPLLESATRFRSFTCSKELIEEDLVCIEKDIFVGFYSIRKLMDTVKISDSTKKYKLQFISYPNIEKVNWLNNHKLDELYDFDKNIEETRDLRFVCNQIIHSFIFMSNENEDGGLGGILFTSDRDKDKKLYSLPIDLVINVFEIVGNDYPAHSVTVRDPETGELDTKV